MPAVRHEVTGDMAERAITALERIADALEDANKDRRERHSLEDWKETQK
jgi:hypothetical protein